MFKKTNKKRSLPSSFTLFSLAPNTFNKGYTLIEILITLSLLTILAGIATISYSGYVLSVNKTDMNSAGKLFIMSLKSCISASGGWEIKNSAGTVIKPCLADTQNNPEELKKKLNFDCPKDAVCKTTFKWNTQPHKRYYCLSITKETQGKKNQILVRYPIAPKAGTQYQIWCGEMASNFLDLQPRHCKEGPGFSGGGGGGGNLITLGFKKPCSW